MVRKILLTISGIWFSFLMFLPDEFSKFRVAYYNKRGCKINSRVSISPNVRIRGKVEINEGSSIAQNCTISAAKSTIYIGKDVMIAPNVVIVAFNHGSASLEIPMVKQSNIEAAVIIEDDVWIGANCTICMGIIIGKGSIIAANSCVTKNVDSYGIYGGVPARFIKYRNKGKQNI